MVCTRDSRLAPVNEALRVRSADPMCGTGGAKLAAGDGSDWGATWSASCLVSYECVDTGSVVCRFPNRGRQ